MKKIVLIMCVIAGMHICLMLDAKGYTKKTTNGTITQQQVPCPVDEYNKQMYYAQCPAGVQQPQVVQQPQPQQVSGRVGRYRKAYVPAAQQQVPCPVDEYNKQMYYAQCPAGVQQQQVVPQPQQPRMNGRINNNNGRYPKKAPSWQTQQTFGNGNGNNNNKEM